MSEQTVTITDSVKVVIHEEKEKGGAVHIEKVLIFNKVGQCVRYFDTVTFWANLEVSIEGVSIMVGPSDESYRILVHGDKSRIAHGWELKTLESFNRNVVRYLDIPEPAAKKVFEHLYGQLVFNQSRS